MKAEKMPASTHVGHSLRAHRGAPTSACKGSMRSDTLARATTLCKAQRRSSDVHGLRACWSPHVVCDDVNAPTANGVMMLKKRSSSACARRTQPIEVDRDTGRKGGARLRGLAQWARSLAWRLQEASVAAALGWRGGCRRLACLVLDIDERHGHLLHLDGLVVRQQAVRELLIDT